MKVWVICHSYRQDNEMGAPMQTDVLGVAGGRLTAWRMVHDSLETTFSSLDDPAPWYAAAQQQALAQPDNVVIDLAEELWTMTLHEVQSETVGHYVASTPRSSMHHACSCDRMLAF